jgi:titin
MYRVLRQIGGSGPYTQHAAMNVSDFASRIVSTTLTDLTPVTSYRFQVAAVNTHGTGPAGPASAAVTTLAGVPGRVPSLPTVHNIASISLILMWSQPANHGAPILGYRIMVAEGDATEFTEYLSTTDNDIVIHSIIGLLPATRYRFTVAAINAFGTGPASEPSAATTTEIAAPSQPGTPVPSQVGLDSVLLTWDAPARSNGALISGYRIRTQTGSSTRSDVHVLNSGSDATSARVTGLQQYVTYRFQVQAINIVGVGEASEFGLPVTTLSGPGTVAQVAVSDVSASSVVLSWVAPPSRGREILGYRVEGKVDGVAYMTMPTNITFVGNKVVAHVMDLRAFKAYQFAIVAFNDLSVGAPSTAIDVLTAVGVPGVIPGPPTVGKVTATSVVLNWNPPLESNGAAVTGYRVSSQMNGVGEFVEEALNLQGGEYVLATVGNLTANTVYRFKVAAINEAGQGTYSQASEPSTTATDIPGAMPRAPIAMTLNATELTLSWVAPNDHGSPITGYQILRRINGAGAYSVQVNNTKSAATTALVDNLRPNTVYTFKVAAINALGVGELSPETSFSVTSMSAPGSPSLPTVTNVGPASLILMWEPPASNGFPVTAYQIFARIGNASEFIELLRSPTHTNTDMCKYTHAYISYAHTHVHTLIHTHTNQTHSHTHKHTHTHNVQVSHGCDCSHCRRLAGAHALQFPRGGHQC